jgi:hypothetical protein
MECQLERPLHRAEPAYGVIPVCPGVPMLLGTTRTVRGAMATAFLALVITAATEPLMM